MAGGSLRALTNRKGPDNNPVVSPNGKWIAYTGFDDRFQGHQTTKLYLMNRDGSGSKSISDKLDRDIQSPEWAPDNSGVYFIYHDQGDTKLGFCGPDGSCKKLADYVTTATSAGQAAAGGSFSVSRSGVIALTRGDSSVPGDVAVFSGGAGATPRVLTALNQDLLEQKKPGHVEEIWYESSKDKRKIEGWIIHPPDFDASKKYPLILEIHGGPFGDYGDRFDFEKQVWAAMGYVVLYTNPRGSTSYGEEFANLIHHAYPGDDFDDLNSGVDAVIAKGYIDPQAGLSCAESFKPTYRNEGVGVFTPSAHVLCGLPKLDMPPGLQTTGEPLNEARQIVEELVRLFILREVRAQVINEGIPIRWSDHRAPLKHLVDLFRPRRLAQPLLHDDARLMTLQAGRAYLGLHRSRR